MDGWIIIALDKTVISRSFDTLLDHNKILINDKQRNNPISDHHGQVGTSTALPRQRGHIYERICEEWGKWGWGSWLAFVT